MTTRLDRYNKTLLELGERKLASLTENRAPRRILDEAWDDDFVNYCLESGLWNFAIRTAELTYEPSIEPDFGYQRAFARPDDFVRLAGIASDEYFSNPLTQYSDEAGYWFSDLDTIYVRYVSNDSQYGNDLSLWPSSFSRWFSIELAARTCEAITGSASKVDVLEKKSKKFLMEARSKDAMNEGASFPPAGRWVRSRRGGFSGRDRGNRNNLIG